MNILRGSRVRQSSKRANDFTSSIGFDSPLTKHVVAINMAHMLTLARAGEVGKKEASACLSFLTGLREPLKLDPGAEDVHHSLEQQAIRSIGVEAAGYLNLGKSRNDQVATALRMEVRLRILELLGGLSRMEAALVRTMGRSGVIVMPGYTHLQHAQPVTLFHHLQSYFEAIDEDSDRLIDLYSRVNLSPMGAAALAGTSVGLDRKGVASMLGFDGIVGNAMFAVSSRGFVLETLADLELLMVDLSKLAEEVILWSSTEFGFVEVGDEFAATSSIMPQKKNPVVAETIRAKCGSVIGEATAAFAISKALPNAYNLDLQEVTPHLWRALSDTLSSVEMMVEMLPSLRFDKDNMTASLKDDMSTATELANELVRSHGIPFRQAHQVVGELVRTALERGMSLEEAANELLKDVSERVTGRAVKIDKDHIRTVLDVLKTLGLIRTVGGANPRFIKQQLLNDKKTIAEGQHWVTKTEKMLDDSSSRLKNAVLLYLKEVRN